MKEKSVHATTVQLVKTFDILLQENARKQEELLKAHKKTLDSQQKMFEKTDNLAGLMRLIETRIEDKIKNIRIEADASKVQKSVQELERAGAEASDKINKSFQQFWFEKYVLLFIGIVFSGSLGFGVYAYKQLEKAKELERRTNNTVHHFESFFKDNPKTYKVYKEWKDKPQ